MRQTHDQGKHFVTSLLRRGRDDSGHCPRPEPSFSGRLFGRDLLRHEVVTEEVEGVGLQYTD